MNIDDVTTVNIKQLGELSPENMTNDDPEIDFGGEGSSELSDFELSGSENEQIKKEKNSGDDDSSSDYDPISEKYMESARNSRNGDITVN
ncbi:hypothetical protein AYI68_g1411 [Smittium mucronatum]|uniref:Uncharacterized protein n=1 Tax=Smittium mucronatum TaxID=133383 RepID=A0A1R0H5N6_9FUNG|nr:hypothetical protein AYI68_g1411 [Smittium mucronatum]